MILCHCGVMVEAAAWVRPDFVDHAQRTEFNVLGIEVAREREAVERA